MTAPAETQPHLGAARHPATERELNSMDNELQELRARKQAARNARGRLEGMVSDTAMHMNDALSIKHEMESEQARISAEQNKVQMLKESEGRLMRTHDKLSTNLRSIMDRKIKSAETRLAKKQAIAQRKQKEAESWNEKGDSYKSSALQLLEDRKVAKEGLQESEGALERAQREEEKAESTLKIVTRRAEEEIETYRYVEGKAKAAASRAHESDEVVHQAEGSVQKLKGILDVEQKRIDHAMEIGKEKLRGKIHDLETGTQQESKHLEKLRQEYTEWQKMQRDRVDTVAQAQATTKQLSDAFHNEQDQILDEATSKAAKQAVDNSAWDWDALSGEQKDWADDNVRLAA